MDTRIETYRPKYMVEKGVDIKDLIDTLHPIAVKSFQRDLPYEAIDNRVRENDLVMLVRDIKTNEGIGYVGLDNLNLANTPTTYLCSVLLNPEIQKKDLGYQLSIMGIENIGNDNLLVRTQNPQMYGLFKKICNSYGLKIAPNGSIPQKAINIARAYDPEVQDNLVRKNIYFGRSLMPNTPEPRCDDSKKIWSNLDIESGDATYLFATRNWKL